MDTHRHPPLDEHPADDADELRCRRQFFGRADGHEVELYCRSCSRKRSRGNVAARVLVYHRWVIHPAATPTRLPDRVTLDTRPREE